MDIEQGIKIYKAEIDEDIKKVIFNNKDNKEKTVTIFLENESAVYTCEADKYSIRNGEKVFEIQVLPNK